MFHQILRSSQLGISTWPRCSREVQTDILIDWINNVPLSRTIHSIDGEFSNGYLIGELLHYHNQIDNFSSLSINALQTLK